MIVKRRKRDIEKDKPFGLNNEVGMRVACAEKAARGWKQPPDVKIVLPTGIPAGNEKGITKGKEIKKVEL